MSQMTEAAKQRAKEYAETVAPESIRSWVETAYCRGTQDPDANKELLGMGIKYVEDLMYPEAKNRDMGTYNKAIHDAVNRLNKIREARK